MRCSVSPLRQGKDSGLRASEAGDLQHWIEEVLTEGCTRENVRKTRDPLLTRLGMEGVGGFP